MTLFDDFIEGAVQSFFYVWKNSDRHLEALTWAAEHDLKINTHSPLVFYDSIVIANEALRVEFKLRFM